MAQRSFSISVAGWSLHKEIFDGSLKAVDAFQVIREELDLGAFELVNTLLEVPTAGYVARMATAASKHDVVIPLIMCDEEGHLGGRDAGERARAVRDHTKWLHIASDLGCQSIRVNWSGFRGRESDSIDDFIARSRGSFESLVGIAEASGLAVTIENHGGPSSDAAQLVRLMKAVDSPSFGTLPDFGNFPPGTDIYAAVDAMMPWAKALSAKCYDFDDDGNETRIDFDCMLEICIDKHGYSGYVGIEYEGNRLAERDGIIACRNLLQRLRG